MKERINPLRRFGQNYLFDQNILDKIVNEINPQEEDNIVEIGPGTGALTSRILGKSRELTAVEIDKRVIDKLKNELPGLNLISEDFLKTDLYSIFSKKEKKLRITGNIPYNLTSSIIFKLIGNNEIIEDAVLMVQYEVAKRMTGRRGTKDYGILSVLLQFFTETRICFKVPPGVFYPQPKINSAVIHLYFKNNIPDKKLKETFILVVKAAFGKRRKTLKNSLSSSIFKEINFSGSGLDLSLRAEQLKPEDFLTLAKEVIKQGETPIIKQQILPPDESY